MSKLEFLTELRDGLCGLPQEDITERLSFYTEMIDDRIEEGMSEAEAIEKIGSVDEIILQIIDETPFKRIVKEKIKPKRGLRGWEITLIILGFPLWFPLLIAAFAVFLALYISIWSVIISLWAVFVSFIATAFGGVISGIVFICLGKTVAGITMLAAAAVCAGLSIFMFFGCKATTKGILLVTKKLALVIKGSFVGKEKSK